MARLSWLLFLSLSASLVSAAPAAGARTQYAPSVIPSVWSKLGDAPPSTSITFDLIFAPKDAAGLEQRMLEISDSQSAWLTEEEIASYIVPSDEVKATVEAAVQTIGATDLSYSRNGDTLTLTTTIAQAAKFFNTQFHEYSHTEVSGSFYKTLQYTIPESIQSYIADVSPFASFGHTEAHYPHAALDNEERATLDSRASDAPCNPFGVTSACIRALYKFDTYTPTTSTGTPRLGIMAYLGENFNSGDLTTYLKQYRPEAAGYRIPVTNIAGGLNNPLKPGLEAALDTQTAAGIIYPLPSRFYDLGPPTGNADIYLATFKYFLGLSVKARPSVISISYGSLEMYHTSAQAHTMCSAAQQLTAAGMTIVVSSGDYGVRGQKGTTCPIFHPTYPSGCPYILSVGATQGFSPEIMVDESLAGFYSGAGFSTFFPTPSYQTQVVAAYEKALGATDNGLYNKKGRAYPDVSAQGSRQEVIVNQAGGTVGGTSASAPIIASGLTLLNDILIKKHKRTIGWANPTFYKNPHAFTDVTRGGSYACGTSPYGFPANAGWDASAGLGTPLFTKLRQVYRC